MEQDLYLHGLIKAVPVEVPAWTRPTDWLTVPELELTDDKIHMLVGLVPNTTANYFAFVCTGNYTVDWGDGSAPQNIASGVKAEHQYDWNDIDPLTLTSDGYLQAIITITPNGGSLLTFSLNYKHTNSVTQCNQIIYDLVLNTPSATQLVLPSYWYMNDGAYESVRRIVLGEHSLTTMTGFAAQTGIYSFRAKGSFSGVTTVAYMFDQCYHIQEVIFDQPETFNNCTNFTGMFFYCWSLKSAPAITMNPLLTINCSSMFYNCTALREIPLYDFSSCTDMSYIFKSCYSLQSIPPIDTSSNINFTEMFNECATIMEIPQLNTSSGTDFTSMFEDCYGLVTIPSFDTSNATTVYNMLGRTVKARAIIDGYDVSNCIDAVSSTLATDTNLNRNKIRKYNVIGHKFTFSLAGSLLDRDNLIIVFNNLATVVGKTITITGNPGVPNLTGADLLIATSKGWTVVT